MPTMAKSRLSITPNQKKRKVMMMVAIEPMAMMRKAMSRWVRIWSFDAEDPPFISLAANETALLMMPHDLMMPMTPAMAIPPMPMLLP